MMEILFKARRLDNGEWVEGDLLHDVFVEMIGEKSEAAIVTPFSGTFPVDPETICQYTGLTDSNGVMIFEGDVLEYKDNYTSTMSCTVEFLRSAFMAVWPNDWDNEIVDKGFSKYAKVIGNIHDNEE